jgi:uncharacterized heparinase superfamily protein
MNLKFVQIYYRLYYLFAAKMKYYRLKGIEKKNCDAVWEQKEPVVSFIKYQQWKKEDIDQHSFLFLNEKVWFETKLDWSVPEKGRLWRYNLHYFQYLLLDEPDLKQSLSLIDSWIKENPAGTPDAWDPFPISLRLVNWIKFLSSNEILGKNLEPILLSIKQQGVWLEKNLEFHLLGNHLFKNGKALVFLGLFFKGRDPERWLTKGLKILKEEVGVQILPDGGHFERSPMYHSMVLEDCLDLLNISAQCHDSRVKHLCTNLRAATEGMVNYLDWMRHPDGQIALFNDAAFGIEVPPEDLFFYYKGVTGRSVEKPEDRFCALSDSGYYILAPSEKDRMIIDCGHVGPDYQPGHSHCDTLSFELSVQGERVIVDSGCFQYEDSPIRKYNRSNAGHNTITIDDGNQSEVWSAHRCARSAKPLGGECGQHGDGTLFFSGGHDGYTRLKGSPLHHRDVKWKGQNCQIKDTIAGQGTHSITSRLHINPLFDVEMVEGKAIVKKNDRFLLKIGLLNEGKIELKKGWYCPEFGIKHECVVLEYAMSALLPFDCGWILETYM